MTRPGRRRTAPPPPPGRTSTATARRRPGSSSCPRAARRRRRAPPASPAPYARARCPDSRMCQSMPSCLIPRRWPAHRDGTTPPEYASAQVHRLPRDFVPFSRNRSPHGDGFGRSTGGQSRSHGRRAGRCPHPVPRWSLAVARQLHAAHQRGYGHATDRGRHRDLLVRRVHLDVLVVERVASASPPSGRSPLPYGRFGPVEVISYAARCPSNAPRHRRRGPRSTRR
jgi:hypothetical protein